MAMWNEFKSFRTLNESLLTEFKDRSVVMDGEIVCLSRAGKPEFRDLLFRRGEPLFVAFDLLWCDGQDLRYPTCLAYRNSSAESRVQSRI